LSAGNPNPQCIALPLTINSTQVKKDGIPALTDPDLVAPGEAGSAYVNDSTRVVGLEVGGTHIAVPLNVLWWHEVVNISMGGEHVAVTFCPLTGSSLVFDRQGIGGLELRVSGLLYDNNLIMFDATSDDSLWPQMLGQAVCGPARGQSLGTLASLQTSWAVWRELHPESRLVSDRTGYDRDYALNPYEDYWRLDAPPAFGESLPDDRRLPKELTLVVPSGSAGGVALPFRDRPSNGREALHVTAGDAEYVVFWDGPSQTGSAFFAFAEWPADFRGPNTTLTFTATSEGYMDTQTGSLWTIDGRAVSGPATGARLARHPRSFVAFWFAWTALRPDLTIYSGTASTG
jgi:uncharacterized protein DUF3179